MSAHQQGVSLPVVLVLLLAMALLGAAVLQSGLLHARMAADAHVRMRSFQAAEGALRMGEQVAAGSAIPSGASCLDGLCGTPAANAIERWRLPGFGGWQRLPGEQVGDLPDAEFIVEYLGLAPTQPGCERAQPMVDNCLRPLYRVTARSMSERGMAMLQTHYLDARVSWREVELD